MDGEGFVLYVASHPGDFGRLAWCPAKMPNASIVAPSNVIACCGFMYQKELICLMEQ